MKKLKDLGVAGDEAIRKLNWCSDAPRETLEEWEAFSIHMMHNTDGVLYTVVVAIDEKSNNPLIVTSNTSQYHTVQREQNFEHIQPRYRVGLEIETSCKSKYVFLSNFCHTETDSSLLQYSCEIVTDVLDYRDLLKEGNNIFKLLSMLRKSEMFFAWKGGKAGIHIHFSPECLKAADIFQGIATLMETPNEQISELFGRHQFMDGNCRVIANDTYGRLVPIKSKNATESQLIIDLGIKLSREQVAKFEKKKVMNVANHFKGYNRNNMCLSYGTRTGTFEFRYIRSSLDAVATMCRIFNALNLWIPSVKKTAFIKKCFKKFKSER